MKLSEKGHYAPPPRLPRFAQQVSKELARIPEVHARTHWYLGDETVVDGADFYLGDHGDAAEIGHIHLDAQAHIALPQRVVRALIDAELAKPAPWGGSSFIVFDIESAADAAHALWLFDLSLSRGRGEPVKALLSRVEERAKNTAA